MWQIQFDNFNSRGHFSGLDSMAELNQKNGFTLVELLVGAVLASLTVAAGLKLSQVIVNNNKESERSAEVIELADNAIDQIQQEIRNGEQLIALESEITSKCRGYTQQGIKFLFGIDIPDQAMSLDSYAINSKTGKPNLKSVACPIIYGTKASSGKITLYRIGTNINERGYYMPSQSSTAIVLDNISQKSKRELKCPSGNWKPVKRGGIEVCIDQRLKRMAKITVSVNNGRELPGTTAEGNSMQRQGAAMTEIFRADAMPGGGGGGNTGSKCRVASGCNIGGQPITCDKTSFMIDVSGSMGWYGGRRLAAAKRELLKAIDMCSDGAEINVTAWSNGIRSKVFNSPMKLNRAIRDIFKRQINGFRAGGGTNPWGVLDSNIQDPNVKEMIILSDGETWPRPYGYKRIGQLNCGYGSFANCYNRYNKTYRSNNPVIIKSVSLDLNFCGGRWMGQLADLNGGSCVVSR